MTATARRALPYPEGADIPDVPLWLGALADALDFDMFVIDDDPRPAPGLFGRVHRLASTGAWSFDTGAAWAPIPTGGPYLLTAGGALTGDLDLGGNDLLGALVNEDLQKITTIAAAGAARTLDAAVSPLHDVTLDQNVTFTFAGVDGDKFSLLLRQPAALKTVAWPAALDWADGAVPTQAASTAVLYDFVRYAGRWVGFAHHDVSTAGGHSRTIVKPSDESINSGTVLQADDHLFLPVDANSLYTFMAVLDVGYDTTYYAKIAFVVPAASTLKWQPAWSPEAGGNLSTNSGGWITASGTSRTINGDLCVVFGTLITGVNAGTLALQWAQSVSGGGGATQIARGSSLSIIKQ